MQRVMRQIAGVLLLLGLANCAGPPWTLSRSPDEIAVRWYPDESGMGSAEEIAALHCRSWGKTAQLAADARDGSAEVARYRCR